MIPSIAIVGGGTAGWMAAAALAHALRGKGRIQLVETPDEPRERGGEGTLPAMGAFHASLGIDEDDLIRRTGATFKLGTAFADWPQAGARFFHPFGPYGVSIDTVGFHHAWLRLRELGEGAELNAYSLAATAASLGRFQRPSQDASSVLSSYGYGLHLDAAAYRDVLRGSAEAEGVIRMAPKLAGVVLRGEDGFIEALELQGGKRITADLFVDCTDQGRLIRQALGAGWQDWSAWLPCDRTVTADSAPAEDPPPYTEVAGREGGWVWRMPLQDRTTHGLAYCSQALDDGAAAEVLLAGLERPALEAPSVQRFAVGRSETFWSRNCVALGGAAGVLGPLEATRLGLIRSGVSRLIGLLPAGDFERADAEEFNRLSIAEFDRARDFLILRHGAGRRETALPDELACRLELFEARGRVVTFDEELFPMSSWLALLIGKGVRPRRYHPFADGLDLQDLRGRLQTLRAVVRQAAESMPTHAAFIARNPVVRMAG